MAAADLRPYDAVVIGAGICGVTFLAYARERGLSCLALEKQDDVGGLWNHLPEWQDIQNRREDYALNDVPLAGVRQPDIQRYVREWVERYNLASLIKLRHEVTSLSRDPESGVWLARTNAGSFFAKHVIVATGVQNEPWIPEVARERSNIVEKHSSRLYRPAQLAGRRVTVVGGGTSAWDLLELAIEHGAADIHWVHRSIKWFLPTNDTKQRAWPNLRELAVVQSLRRSADRVTAFLRWLLRIEFRLRRVKELEPKEPFDIRKHQLIPGRSVMLRNLDSITRHRSEVTTLRGSEVTLANGERIDTDVLLWGTGYRMSLAYLDVPELAVIDRLEDLRPRLGSLVRSKDHPDLFFLGMTLAESTSVTPFFAAIEARSIVSHILGECEIPTTSTPHQVTHWGLHRFFATFDHANYPRPWWKVKWFFLAFWYWLFRNRPVRV